MATPSGDPFTDASVEAAQIVSMAVRLTMAIAEAARRRAQQQAGVQDAVPPVEDAVPAAQEALTRLLPPDLSDLLLKGADWPQMAQQLMALQQAGVDLALFVPQLGEMAASVHQAVLAQAASVVRDPAEHWTTAVRETLPAGPVREAILSSPQWPDMAATMDRLQQRGVDVRALLARAHEQATGVDRAVAQTLNTPAVPVSKDAKQVAGPLTAGLDVPRDLNLDDRQRAFAQLALSSHDADRYVRWVREALPGQEQAADALVTARLWPLLAARMADMRSNRLPVQEHLARLVTDASWAKGPASELGLRMVQATHTALTSPVGAAPGQGPRVSTAAAKAQSTVGPTRPPAKTTAPVEPGVAAHRQTGAAPTRSKAK
ncbi:hypothetical protein [Streptomyces collinus]|uniref:hypothetical protein n=1 Tax=Streptomyces collinus TaxID=42684 RepID=UPI0033C3078E